MQHMLLDLAPEKPEIRRRTEAIRAEFESLIPKVTSDVSDDQPVPIQQTNKDIQLPLWSNSYRGVPNSVLRSALFPAIQGKGRKYLKRVHLKTHQGIEIHFTGMQLDQSDLDVWEHSLHLARQHPLGTECHFSARSFLKDIRRSTGKRDYEWLKDSFGRLAGAVVDITHGDLTYFGTLINGGLHHKTENYYWLSLNPNMVTLYAAGYWTAINWEQRQDLRRKPLALWLHGYYASHANPYPLKVATLRDLSGSSTHELRRFKQNLSNALDALKNAGAITSWHINNNLVHVRTTTRAIKSATPPPLNSRAPKP